MKKNTSHFYALEKSHTNLDGLRDELIKRVSANKKNRNVREYQEKSKLARNTDNLFEDSIELSNKVINTSLEHGNKSAKTFNNLNMHFEELMIKDTDCQLKKKKNEFSSSKGKPNAFQ